MEKTATILANEERARKQLVRQCRELEVEAQRLRTEVVSHARTTCESPKREPDDPLVTLVRLREEECLLRERLSCMQDSPPEASTGDQTVLERRLVSGLHKTVDGLKSSIATLDVEHEQLLAALRRHRGHTEQLKELSDKVTSLRKMTSPSVRQEAATSSQSAAGASMATLTKEMKRRYRRVESMLSDFLDEYFPEEMDGDGAGDAAVSPSRRKKKYVSGSGGGSSGGGSSGGGSSGGGGGGDGGTQERSFKQHTRPADTFSLAVTIEQLLRVCVGDQSEAYITWTADHWAPYKELLVGTGIVEQHPADCDRIRLVPVHGDLVVSGGTSAT